jgi:hypothetical protein
LKKRRVLALLAGLSLLALVPGSTLAVVGTIDQSNVPAAPPPVTNTSGTLAESFTVGQTGLMTAVDLYLITAGGAVSTTVNILALDGSGHPTGAALATGTVSVSTTGAFINFPFTTALSVTAGQKYAIVVVLGDAGPWWYGDTGNTYGGGDAMFTNSFPTGWTAPAPPVNTPILDYYFRTYVAPPLPPGATAPPTSTVGNGSSNSSTLPAALLICIAFGGLALVAVEARRLRTRNETGPR